MFVTHWATCARLVVMILVGLSLFASSGSAIAQDVLTDAQVAFVGSDGNIWLARPDGSDQRVAIQPGVELGMSRLVVSPDGAMVAQADPRRAPIRIWHTGDGRLVEIPGSDQCIAPQFTADSQRLVYTCTLDPTGLFPEPPGLVLSSAVNGSDPRVELPMPVGAPGGIDDVRLADGAMLVSAWRDTDEGQGSLPHTVLYDAQLNELAAFEGTEVPAWGRQALFDIRFAPGGDAIVARVCESGCIYNQETIARDFLIGFDGRIIERITPQWLIDVGGDRMSIPATAAVEAGTEVPGAAGGTEPDGTGVAAVPAELETGQGWIAYVSTGIKLVRPDLSEMVTLVEIDGGSDLNPVWSHDGTMLAWNGPAWPDPMFDPYRGIWVFANGEVRRLPGTEGCLMPAFSGDNARVYYICPDVAHQHQPVEAIIPEHLVGVPATGVYIPSNAWLGSISSSAIDGSDQRVELAYDGSGDPAWGGLGGEMMVYRLEVRSTDGAVMVLYRNPVAPPTVAGTLVLDADLNVASNTPLAEGDIFPVMLPDGTIVTPRGCDNLCPNGLPVTFTALDGTEVDAPVAAQILGPAWTFDLSPDASRAAGWSYHDGLWIEGVDGNRIPVDPSGMYPAWQPVPVEIVLPG